MKNITCLFLLLASFSFGQHSNFNTQRNWSMNKKEIVFGLGATQFLGDLGGRNRIGRDYSIADIDFPSTGIGGMVGYRYRFHPYWATTTSLNVGLLRGSDAKTSEIIRNSRNLEFRSIIVELHQRLEFIVLSNEKVGARYKVRGHKYAKNKNTQLYVFGGVGVSYFNPKARYNGAWTALRPLSTEGQGMADGIDKTLPVTLTLPSGFGVRVGMGQMWRIGLEATYVKTFSDYIDDVHGVYYDPSKLSSPQAAYLSNPAQNNSQWFGPGQQRGDKQNDTYFYLNIVAQRNITYKNYTKKGGKYTWKGGRYKF